MQVVSADAKLGILHTQLSRVEKHVLSEQGTEAQVNDLLQSVVDVKNEYQNLRKEVSDVQDLQKQISSALQANLRAMQANYAVLRSRLPQPGTTGWPNNRT